jgi:hypothetical protein
MGFKFQYTKSLLRKTKYSGEHFDNLLDALERGLPLKIAAAVAGIPVGTVRMWVQKGEEGVKPYDEVANLVTAARAQAIEEQIERVSRASRDPKYWRAAAWLLEKLDPEDFAPKAEDTGDEPVEIVINVGGSLPENDDGD